MFDIAPTELLIVAIVALVVIGPKDLPNVLRTVGQWIGRARGMARHFRSGMDTMIREAELEEMEKKWREENDRIMSEHPMLPLGSDAPDYDDPAMQPPPSNDPSTEPPLPLDEPGPLDAPEGEPPAAPGEPRP